MADSGDDDGTVSLFNEPEGYYQREKSPTIIKHHMLSGQELTLRLVGHNPLWVGTFSINLSSFLFQAQNR